MKRIFTIITLVSMLTILGSFAIVFGAEEIVTGTVESVTTALDKNGETYTRVLVNFDRSLQGTDYSVILPAMGFGEQAEPAAALAQGSEFKAIAQNRLFNGRESYTIIQLLE